MTEIKNTYGSKHHTRIYSHFNILDEHANRNNLEKNMSLMRDILSKIITLPSKEEIFKYNNNHEYIPIIDESVTKVTYEKRNKDIIYDYMMSYHENKYLCWFLYCIIINIYIKIDDIIIQGGFIRNMFEHMHIQKSSIDIDMYLLSEFLIMQKEFIMIDFQLEIKNKSCRNSLPAYMNFIDSTVNILNYIINENTTIVSCIEKISIYDRVDLPNEPDDYSINVTYKLICVDEKEEFELSFDMNKKTYSSFSNNITRRSYNSSRRNDNSSLINYYNTVKQNNIDNVDYLQNSLILVKNKKTKKLEIDLRIPIEKLNPIIWKSLELFNIKNIIIILLNYQPFIIFNNIPNIILSFLTEQDKLQLIIYYSISCNIMIACHALCTDCIDLYSVENNIDLIGLRLAHRKDKFKDRNKLIIEYPCDKRVCSHKSSFDLKEIITINKHIETTTHKLINLLNKT